MPVQKKTFDEVVAEVEASRHNSNLSNLASAMNMLREREDRYKRAMENIAEIRADIEMAGKNPDTLTLEQVRELYNRAFGAEKFK
jgi:hypothetical protein